MQKFNFSLIHLFYFIINIFCFTFSLASPPPEKVTKIVAIHSYSEDFPWTRIIINSYRAYLDQHKLKYTISNFYFDIKKHPYKKTEINPLIEKSLAQVKNLKPDLIFITDDYALTAMSTYLVSSKTPFIFSGINGKIPDDILKSGFKKYSGVYERYYLVDSIKLLQKLINKKALSLLVLLEESETSNAVLEFFKDEVKNMKTIKVESITTNDFNLWKEKILIAHKKFDAILPLQPYSLFSEKGTYLTPMEVINWIYLNSKLPSIFTSAWHIKCGGTLAIAHRPKAQGELSAQFTLDLINNKINEPIVPPQGDIVLNYAVTEKLKLKIPFDLLSTATIEKKIETPCNPN